MLTSTVCVALSAAGLAVALLTAYRRRWRAAARTAAFALLPVGLYMTGLVTLGGKVGRAVGNWAADLVFKPSVWAGFGVLAASLVLYAAARIAGRRKGAATGRRERAAERKPERTAATGGAPAPSLPAGREERPKAGTGTGAGKDDSLSDFSDFSDVEEILRRHGI